MYRYGPEVVTSRFFSRWPAAHTRSPSPTRARAKPTAQRGHVGSPKTSAITTAAAPSATRRRTRNPSISDSRIRDSPHTLDNGLHRLVERLSLIHISEPTRLLSISYAVF